MTKLSKISKLNPCDIWPHEAHDFTKWLAIDENIALLSEELQIQFKNVSAESSAGRYFVDIVADVAKDGGKAIIENQLGITNHKHLGQLITYASALEAKFILWMVTDFNEEHRQAIDWLNRHISDQINFFLIQVEVYRIDNSRPAPKFNVICEPNNWVRIMQRSASGNKVSDTKLLQHEYWEQLIAAAHQKKTKLSFRRKARPQHYYNLTFGTSRAHIVLTINTQKKILGCEVYIRNDKEFFDNLLSHKEDIETLIGQSLNWMRLDNTTASRIQLTMNGSIQDKAKWDQFNSWFIETSKVFANTFGRHI